MDSTQFLAAAMTLEGLQIIAIVFVYIEADAMQRTSDAEMPLHLQKKNPWQSGLSECLLKDCDKKLCLLWKLLDTSQLLR